MLVDSHCHLDRLDLSAYKNGLTGAIEAAFANGVSKMLCVCISAENKQAVLDIAHNNQNIFASVGVHPSDVDAQVVSVETLCEWATAKKVVALGETGLDYHYSKDMEEHQKASFRNHLLAGERCGLPVIVHTRDARDDTVELIKNYSSREYAGVMHCFTETWEMAASVLDLNYFISISGIVTFKNANDLREVVKKIPLDRLLIETDSPYLAPVPYRGKSNEPKYVRAVAEYIAELKQISFEKLAEISSQNFSTLFKKAN